MSRATSKGLFDGLSTPYGVMFFWLCFGVFYSLVQITFSSTLPLDDAQTAESMQGRLLFAYQIRNPPLYEWLLWGMQQFLGESGLSHRVLRYSLIAVIGMLVYCAMRQAQATPKLAAAASFSHVLFFWFGWDFHYRVTHTLPMLIAGLAAWMIAISFRKSPNIFKALALGLAFGIGTISKWSFPLFISSLLVALLCEEQGRRALVHPRFLLLIAGMIIPLMPVLIGISNLQGDILVMAQKNLVASDLSHGARMGKGLTQLLVNMILFQLPWVLFLVVITGWTRTTETRQDVDKISHLALLTVGLAIVFTIVSIVLFGLTHIDARYLYPLFLTYPIGVLLWISRQVSVERFSHVLIITSIIAAFILLVGRAASLSFIISKQGASYNALLPYDGLVRKLADKGLDKARYVTKDLRDAGNLHAHLPLIEVAAVRTNRIAPPATDGKSRECVIIWQAGWFTNQFSGEKTIPDELHQYLGHLNAEDIEVLTVPASSEFNRASLVAVWLISHGPNVQSACQSIFRTSN